MLDDIHIGRLEAEQMTSEVVTNEVRVVRAIEIVPSLWEEEEVKGLACLNESLSQAVGRGGGDVVIHTADG